jgi:multiple sugar transport system substrate-binding protein
MSRRFTILARRFGPFEKAVRIFWDQLAKARGLDLELELIPLDLPELHAAILTGRFDVAHVNTDWLAECWARGCLEDLSGRTRSDPPEDYPAGWPASLLGLQTFADGLAGIPFHDGPECLIYRKDLFASELERRSYRARYGAELAPPRTWAEFKRIAAFFERPEEGLHGTLFALYPDGHNNVFDFALQVLSRGGSLERDDRVVLDSPEALEALQDYRGLINSPFIHPESRQLESIGACWTFARGEVAMMVNWFGFATMCETVEGSRVGGRVDICAVPHAESHPDPVSLNVYYVWSIGRDSQHKDLAYDYIRNGVRKENDVILTMEGGIGCRRSTWFDPGVNRAIPYYSRMAEVHGYASTLPRSVAWHAISSVIDELVIDTIDTDRPVAAILQEAQARVDAIAASPGRRSASTADSP